MPKGVAVAESICAKGTSSRRPSFAKRTPSAPTLTSLVSNRRKNEKHRAAPRTVQTSVNSQTPTHSENPGNVAPVSQRRWRIHAGRARAPGSTAEWAVAKRSKIRRASSSEHDALAIETLPGDLLFAAGYAPFVVL
jgi:hypothetical protein